MDTAILDSQLAGNNAGLSDQAKDFLKETAKWAKFIAIVNFVFIAFMVIGSFSVATLFNSIPEMADNPAFALMGGGMIAGIYLFFAAIWFIPNLYLFQFATKTQRAVKANDGPMMTEALGKLKSHYKFWGIFMAIIIGFYLLIFVLAGLGAAFA